MIYNQCEFNIRCEWGLAGLQELAPISDVVVIVDILSFSTCVEIATANQAIIYPYQYRDESVKEYAVSIRAKIASKRGTSKYSLSPQSLIEIPAQTKLVLPSPNGSTLSLYAKSQMVIAACLRNSQAVAEHIQYNHLRKIAVIPAGEKWQNGSLRPALEDLLGAGAIINYLQGVRSPEAKAAEVIFASYQHHLLATLKKTTSGKELIHKGFTSDVEIAAKLNISRCVPLLKNNAYTAAKNERT